MKLHKRTNQDKDFLELTSRLDMDLHKRYGTQEEDYSEHNKIDLLNTVLIAYIKEEAIACACFRKINHTTVEIKRMFVKNSHRGKGYSRLLLLELENWAKELGYTKAILETGKGQPEAISLYKKSQYFIIENYGVYKNLDNSICMSKLLV